MASADATREPINRLKALWRADKPALGILLTAPSVQVTQVLARAGFDWLLVDMEHGPIDLATALGVPGQLGHPDVVAAVERAEAAILASGVALGGMALSPDQANQQIERGYRMLALGFDWSLLQRGAATVLEGVRRG